MLLPARNCKALVLSVSAYSHAYVGRVGTFHKVQKGKFNVGFKPSLAPFMAFHFLLSPVLALILLMLWLGCFLASKRLASSGLTVYLFSPLLLLLVVDYQLPYYLGLTLSVGAAWGLKNVLMRDYPFKERVF